MPRKHLFLLLFFGFSNLSGMAGKPPPIEEAIFIYKKDKPTRKVSFIEFELIDGQQDMEYLQKDIPKTIAVALRKIETIQVPTNELVLSWENESKYDIEIQTNDSTTLSNLHSSQNQAYKELDNALFDHINKDFLTEKYSNELSLAFTNLHTLTNNISSRKKRRIENEITLAQKKITFLQQRTSTLNVDLARFQQLTNKTHQIVSNTQFSIDQFPWTNAIDTILFESTNQEKGVELMMAYRAQKGVKYIDTRHPEFKTEDLSNFLQIFSNSSEIYTVEDIPRFLQIVSNTNGSYLFIETNYFQRKLIIENSIYAPKKTELSELIKILKKNGSEFGVYGHIHGMSKNEVNLSIFMIRTFENSISKIFEKRVKPEKLFDELSILPDLILANIQNVPIVTDLKFDSTPEGAYIYLNNYYLGKTPLAVKSFPQGLFEFQTWHPSGTISLEQSSLSLVNPPIWASNQDAFFIEVKDNLPTQTIFFNQRKDKSLLYLNLGGDIKSDIYINSIYSGTLEGTKELLLPVGEHFIKLTNDTHQSLNIHTVLESDQASYLDIQMPILKKKTKARKFFGNWERHFKIFSAIGFPLMAAATVTGIHLDDLQNQQNSISLGNPIRNTIGHERSRVNQIFNGLLISGLTSLSLAVVSKIIDVKKKKIKVQWENRKSKYVKYRKTPITLLEKERKARIQEAMPVEEKKQGK